MGIPKTGQFSGKIVPIVLLAFAILSTIGIYSYNMYLEGENSRLASNIQETKEKITEIQKDPNLQVFKLLEDNKKTINKLESQSQVTTFMQRLTDIEQKYKLDFDGFSYSAGVISSSVTTSSSSLPPYSIVVDFIKRYRAYKNTYFTLPFINGITGSDRVKFDLKFNVKDSILQSRIIDTKEEITEIKDETTEVKTNKQLILEQAESNKTNTSDR